jgi:hypothetical protein
MDWVLYIEYILRKGQGNQYTTAGGAEKKTAVTGATEIGV